MKKFKNYLESHKTMTITVLLVLIIAIMTFTTVISYNLLYDYNHDESMYNYNHDKSMDDVVLEPNRSTTKKTSYTYYNQTKEYSLTLDNEKNTYTYKICTNAKCNYYIGIWKQEEHLLILSVESIYDMNDCYYSNDWEVAAFNFKVNGNTLVTTNDIKLTKTKKTLDDNVTKPTTNCIYKDFTVDSESIIGAYFYEDSAKKDNFNNNTYRYELVLFADDTFIYAQCGSVTCGAYSGTYKMGSNKIILQADKRYGSDDTYKETNETISFNINKDSSISVTDNKTLINLITTKFSNLSTIESYYGSPYFRHNELFKSAETNKETISLKVTFDENGGSDVADLKIENGNKISTPIPYKKGYYFTGWYLNDKEWDDENLVTNDITLKAHWSDLMFVSDPNEKSNPFTTNEVLEKGNKVITHKYFSIYELKYNGKSILYPIINDNNVSVDNCFSNREYCTIYINDRTGDSFALIDIVNKKVIDTYYIIRCSMPSDASTGVCNNINATIIGKRINDTTIFGVFSFDTGKLILPIEYSNVSKISNGNFIIKKDSKMAVIDAKGKFIYNLEYDYIGYSEDTGYLLVKNNELTIKNNKKELSDIENTSINNAYSFYSWNNEDILFNGDINNNDYFTYNGTYSGKQTILYLDVCSNTNKEIYIIKNNKLEKLNANNIQKKLDNIYCA